MTSGEGEAMDLHEMIDRCVERMIAGETPAQVVALYPARRTELRPALEAAATVLGIAVPDANPAVRGQAMRQMMAQLEVAPTTGLGFRRFIMAFSTRPWMFKAASLGGAALLFGVATLGAAAATGNTPQPVRSLFGLSSSSISVEFTGTVVSNDGTTLVVDVNEAAAASTVTPDASATVTDERTVVIGSGTLLSRGDAALSPSDIVPGTVIEVKGSLQPDNTILASRIHVEDEDDDDDATPPSAPGGATETPDADATSTPGPDATSVAPTATEPDDDNDADENKTCDSSGPGNPCEDHEQGTAEAGDDRGVATPSAPGATATVRTDNSGPGSIDSGHDGDDDGTAPAGTATAGDDHGGDGHDGSGTSGDGSGSGGSGPN